MTSTVPAPLNFPPLPDPSSYAADMPLGTHGRIREPYIPRDLVTDDDWNLTRKLGKVLMRWDDNDEPLSVVGTDYTIVKVGTCAQILDDVTAPHGGRQICGPATVYSNEHFAATVKLPDSFSEALSLGPLDPVKRTAGVTIRSSHDGKYQVSLNLWVRRHGVNSGLIVPHGILQARRKHTAGVVLLPSQIKAYADKLPEILEAFAADLRKFAGMRFGRKGLEQYATDIAGETKARERIVDMCLAANGKDVPVSGQAGTFTALQIIEACATFERHHRQIRGECNESHVRLNRLLDEDTYSAKAWGIFAKVKTVATQDDSGAYMGQVYDLHDVVCAYGSHVVRD